MALPTITAEVAFASTPFAAVPVWTNITNDVFSVYTRRGRQHELNRIEAGTATIGLKNQQGNYWPNNAAGLYSPNVVPNKRVRITASYAVAWKRPFAASDPAFAWTNDGWARDGDITTGANLTVGIAFGVWSDYLIFIPTGGIMNMSTIKFYAPRRATLPGEDDIIDIDIYYAGGWHDLYLDTWAGDTWITVPIPVIPYPAVEQIRYRFYNAAPLGGLWQPFLMENEILEECTKRIYTGFAEKWAPSWQSPVGGLIPEMTLQCADIVKRLAKIDINSAGYAQELSGARVGHVLDEIGWPAGQRDLDAGQSLMAVTGAMVDVNAMEHAFIVQDSELGQVFQAPDGDVQFNDRFHRLINHTTSLAIFGDDLGENFYHDIEPEYADDIYNDIRVTRGGGAQQVAVDAPSQLAYGKNTLCKTGLLLITDAEALDQANYLLRRYKDPAMRARTLKIIGERSPAALWPKLLTYDIGDRITVRRNEASIDSDYHIEGIRHMIDLRRHTWIVYWELSDADTQQYWVLGVPGFSELGITTFPAY